MTTSNKPISSVQKDAGSRIPNLEDRFASALLRFTKQAGENTVTTWTIGCKRKRKVAGSGLRVPLPETNATHRNCKVVCVLSWVPELAKTRTWLLTANGYTVVSLLGAEGIRQLDDIDGVDLLVLAHSVPLDEKQHAIELFRRRCGSPVLSLLEPNRAKLPEADYGVDALNPDEFVAAVNHILAAEEPVRDSPRVGH